MTTSNNSTSAPNATPLTPDDFVQDAPVATAQAPAATPVADLIDGVTVTPLVAHGDNRGALTELLTTRDGLIEPIVHVYEVEAKAGSIRGWVYHRHQFDRLAFTRGRFRVVLFDIRQDSPTFNKLSVLILGTGTAGPAAHSALCRSRGAKSWRGRDLHQYADQGLRSPRSGQVPPADRRSADSVQLPGLTPLPVIAAQEGESAQSCAMIGFEMIRRASMEHPCITSRLSPD